jgi:hypothetical protein
MVDRAFKAGSLADQPAFRRATLQSGREPEARGARNGLGKEINEMVSVNDESDPSIVRGEKSWNYFYLFLGFVITIESTLIGMMTPIVFPGNILLFFIVAAITVWLVLFYGPFQNWLISRKNWYESVPR